MSDLSLWLIILIEGFVTISAEILTIRQILPVAGSSVIVTSLIIGIFLLFLAYGYRRGGLYETGYTDILKRNFTWSAFLLGVGLSYIFIFLFFTGFEIYITRQLLIILTVYLLVIIAPLVYILGQTVPITMNLIRKVHTVGGIGGKILQLSTLGSFLGAVLTSLILMNYVGVAWTIVINYGLLVFLILLLIKEKKTEIIRIVSLGIGFVIVFAFNVYVEKQVFVKTNAYANYQIVNKEDKTILFSNESPSSMLDTKLKAFPYIEIIKKIIFEDLKLTNKDILVLGAGGFSISAESAHDNRFTYVDIDPDIEGIVKDHFIKTVNGKLVVSDARYFLNTNKAHYDVIVNDVYSNARSIPAHLLTVEYFKNVNVHLNPGGVALFNIIASPTLQDTYSKTVDNTLRSVFSHCMVMPLHFTEKLTNIIYACQKNPEMIETGLYWDDRNPSPLDFFNFINKTGYF